VWIVGHGDGVGRERAEQLLERYGTRAEALIRDVEGGPETPLSGHDGYSREEIAWLARNERVVHLADLVFRRTSLAFTGALTSPLLDELAEVVGDELGWDAAARRAEVEATRRVLAERHGVVLEAGSLVE
jgi:glycerol-3-phosphate dehydrogenase